jgi:branched-chain amino acid transport system ATP-binding protein
MTALQAIDVSKSFEGVRAVSNVSLSVERGARHLVIGPNGAGKTTLFNVLSGAFPASAGKILLAGKDITRLPANERARLGVARTFQITQLFGRLSVAENLMLAVHAARGGGLSMFRSMKRDRSLSRQAGDMLARWQLDHVADQPAHTISYGQKRQVDLMLALVGSPSVLLLDEPTAGLSAAEVVRVVDMIRALPPDMTVLMIEHDMDIAFDLADFVTVMNQGQVVVEGDVAAVRNNPIVVAIYLGED